MAQPRLTRRAFLAGTGVAVLAPGGILAPIPSWAYQVLLVNKKVGVVGTPPPGSPTAASFMAPDGPSKPDCQPPSRSRMMTSEPEPICDFRATISTVTNTGQMRWRIFDGALNTDILIDFLRRWIEGGIKNLFLILDNLRCTTP